MRLLHILLTLARVKLECLESNHIASNVNNAPQLSTIESLANSSAADVFANRRKFFAHLLPNAAAADNRYEELDQDEYGEVKYWKQDTFNKWFQKYGKNGGPTERGQLSKKLYFLENEHGELIENNEISAMRKALVRIFSSVKEHIPSMLKTWLKNSIEFHDMICIEMRILFPDYFTLCENNWKAQEFVKNWFRNWNRDRAKKGNEDDDDDKKGREDNQADGSGRPSSSKRPMVEENESQPARAVKKAKIVQSRDARDPL